MGLMNHLRGCRAGRAGPSAATRGHMRRLHGVAELNAEDETLNSSSGRTSARECRSPKSTSSIGQGVLGVGVVRTDHFLLLGVSFEIVGRWLMCWVTDPE